MFYSYLIVTAPLPTLVLLLLGCVLCCSRADRERAKPEPATGATGARPPRRRPLASLPAEATAAALPMDGETTTAPLLARAAAADGDGGLPLLGSRTAATAHRGRGPRRLAHAGRVAAACAGSARPRQATPSAELAGESLAEPLLPHGPGGPGRSEAAPAATTAPPASAAAAAAAAIAVADAAADADTADADADADADAAAAGHAIEASVPRHIGSANPATPPGSLSFEVQVRPAAGRPYVLRRRYKEFAQLQAELMRQGHIRSPVLTPISRPAGAESRREACDTLLRRMTHGVSAVECVRAFLEADARSTNPNAKPTRTPTP